MKKYTVLDLFCGAGGLSRGFLDAGFDVVLGVDFDEPALRTFEANHGNAKALKLDLFDHQNIFEIKKYLLILQYRSKERLSASKFSIPNRTTWLVQIETQSIKSWK